MRSMMLGLLAVALPGIVAEGGPILIVDGSFEDTTNFVADGNNSMIVSPGSTALTGWTIVGGANAADYSIQWLNNPNPWSTPASDGNLLLDLTGYHDDGKYGTVEQSVSTTVGDSYTLTFDIGASNQGGWVNSVAILATAGGSSNNVLFTSTPDGFPHWQSETLTFVATSTSTLISFQGSAGREFIGLDNVALMDNGPTRTDAVTPEPTSLALAGFAGLGMAAGAWRRRRQQKQAV